MKNFLDLFQTIEKKKSNDSFLNYLDGDTWVSISTSDFVSKVKYLTLALKDMGVKNGDSVAIIAKPSPWWVMMNFAINLANGVSIPIFPNISSKNLLYELEDADVRFAFISVNENIQSLKQVSFTKVITKDVDMDNSISIDDAFKVGKDLLTKEAWGEIQVSEDNLYSIIYTSGSTGRPKGVELSQKNIMSQMMDVRNIITDISPEHKMLSFLPVAHIFENMLINYYMSENISIYILDDVTQVAPMLQVVQPHYMSVVPRLLQKIFTKVQSNVDEASSPIKKFIGRTALNRATSKDPHKKKTFLDNLFHKLVYKKIQGLFGPNIKFLVTGGAKLPKELSDFYLNIGLPLREGYGLTECSPVVCVNRVDEYKSGTCGRVIESVSVKLSDENELLVKGINVMRGYHNLKDKTDEVIVDGWFHTGDLASIDEDGFITITGRIKELFKTSTGKYVQPIEVESLLAKSIYIDYPLIVANDRPYVVALLFIEQVANNALKEKCEKENLSYEKEFNKIITKLIKKTNKHLDKHAKVQYFKTINDTLSIQTGALTPSMKTNRDFIEDEYKDIINSLYDN